ncbi:MAG: MerR family transcriptional regulator [Calditrichae bacterium]|nr:MerR family transcriptional regulator [Calditrichia bacterium]
MDGRQENGYLKIKEVSQLLGVSPHTVRYWEKEFSDYVNPKRTSAGHRLYDDHQIRQLLEIKHLLKDELYSISGAKNKLKL